MTLTTEDGKPCEGIDQGPFEPIAVIGLGALMPDAHNIDAFWKNILEAKVSIRPLPEGRWPGPIDHFWKEGGPGAHTEGYTYAKIGALVSDAAFDWRRWRQPPGTLPQIDPCQLWAVTVAADAIEHAGYDGENSDIDRSRTGVVFANALGGENRNLSNIRVWSHHTTALANEHGLPPEANDAFTEALLEGTPRVDEDTMPGELANVVSGRVANLLDLQGPNHAMDAACASSMAAVLDACRLLQTRQVDVMLAGATDRTMDPATFAKFSAIGALSPTHSSPFDARANGFVMGEGAGVLLLKRLSDAVRDEDEIYSVIRGIGGSSDGRGKASLLQVSADKSKRSLVRTARPATRHRPLNWSRRTGHPPRSATPPNSQPCLDCGPKWRVLGTLQLAPSSRKSAISRRPLELQGSSNRSWRFIIEPSLRVRTSRPPIPPSTGPTFPFSFQPNRANGHALRTIPDAPASRLLASEAPTSTSLWRVTSRTTMSRWPKRGTPVGKRTAVRAKPQPPQFSTDPFPPR